MELFNTILGIVASLLAIYSTCVSLKTKKDVDSFIKNANNTQSIGSNSYNNSQNIGDGR